MTTLTSWITQGIGLGKRSTSHQHRRRKRRYAVSDVHCALGKVVNISASGACIHARRCVLGVGDSVTLHLKVGRQQLRVIARLVRMRRRGWSGVELGFSFVGLTDSQQAALVSLGKFGFIPVDGEPKQKRQAVHAAYEVPNHYKTLNIRRDADLELIHEAYRKLVRTCHPDVSDDPDAQSRFVAITEAYTTLRDESARQAYDQLLVKLAPHATRSAGRK